MSFTVLRRYRQFGWLVLSVLPLVLFVFVDLANIRFLLRIVSLFFFGFFFKRPFLFSVSAAMMLFFFIAAALLMPMAGSEIRQLILSVISRLTGV